MSVAPRRWHRSVAVLHVGSLRIQHEAAAVRIDHDLSTQSRNVPLFSQVGMTPVWFWVGSEGVGNAGDARHPTAP